jgi:uncharacterized membrane protein
MPFQALSQRTFGFYDHRLLYLVFFGALLALVVPLVGEGRRRDIALLLVGMNPFLALFMIQGRNDIMVLTFMVGALYALREDRPVWAGILLGLAGATKQTAWLLVPFCLLLALGRNSSDESDSGWKRGAALTAVIPALVMLPFLLVSPRAFIDDVLRFQSGLLPGGYPVGGLGLGGLLLATGVIRDSTAPSPFGPFKPRLGFRCSAYYYGARVRITH